MDSFSPFPSSDSPQSGQPPQSQLSLPPPPSVDAQEYHQYLALSIPHLHSTASAGGSVGFTFSQHMRNISSIQALANAASAATAADALLPNNIERNSHIHATTGATNNASTTNTTTNNNQNANRIEGCSLVGTGRNTQASSSSSPSSDRHGTGTGMIGIRHIPPGSGETAEEVLPTESVLQPLSLSTSTPADLRPSLQNIVSTVNLGCQLDLKKIALQARNAEFNPKRFAAVIMRIRAPRTTALIFSSGKMVCTGAKSEEESRLAARKYARIVQKLGFKAKFLDFKIQNMVGSVDVQFPIRLEGLVLQHQQFCSYEPELFPGLIYRMIKPKIVLLIFVSGKVVLTGAKVRQEIYEAFDNIYPILRGFKK